MAIENVIALTDFLVSLDDYLLLVNVLENERHFFICYFGHYFNRHTNFDFINFNRNNMRKFISKMLTIVMMT